MEPEIILTESDRRLMAEHDAALIEEERAEAEQKEAVLKAVQALVPVTVYAEILDELTDGYTFDYTITATPLGKKQDDGAAWGPHFVNQTTNGGYTGDEYSGTVSIPLGDGRFFQFGYAS
ncbi:hypothetical protein [Flavobacterium sp.]|uniref:hypothetical protein n=1 Tax=Flavobacterium sp. TaxID=239 RepID=UPI00261579CE|nr:hypothetical protein [Flavobacterium sp.]